MNTDETFPEAKPFPGEPEGKIEWVTEKRVEQILRESSRPGSCCSATERFKDLIRQNKVMEDH